MCWSKDHVLRTTELKEGDAENEFKDWEREMCRQKPPLKNSEPAGAQSLTKPGGKPWVNTQNGGRQACSRWRRLKVPLQLAVQGWPKVTPQQGHPDHRWALKKGGGSRSKTTSGLCPILLRDGLLLHAHTMLKPNVSSQGDWWAHFMLILPGVGELLFYSCQEENDGRHFQEKCHCILYNVIRRLPELNYWPN